MMKERIEMSKYIIELEDEPVGGLYKAKGFNSLVFDKNGLSRLKPYKEEEKPFPRVGEKYYFISSEGNISTCCFTGKEDANRYSIGNIFSTYEEANFMVEKLKVIAELKQFAEPDSRPWDNKTQHWVLTFRYGELDANYCSIGRGLDPIYFDSREATLDAIDKVGEYRIKKYLFGV